MQKYAINICIVNKYFEVSSYMQILKNKNLKSKFNNSGYSQTIGYFGQTRLLGFEFIEDNNRELWVAKVVNNNIIEFKELKFIKTRDEFLPSKKIEIYILNTIHGDVKLTDFKAMQSHSILETIPKELITYVDNI